MLFHIHPGVQIGLYFKNYLLFVQIITQIPLDGEDHQATKGGPDCHRDAGKVQQAAHEDLHITIQPMVADEYEEEVNENGVHPDDHKEGKVFSMPADVYPFITKGQHDQRDAAGGQDKRARRYPFEHGSNIRPIQ